MKVALTAIDLPISRLMRALWADERGASHLEYAIIAFGAGTFLVAGLIVLSGGLETFFSHTASVLASLL
jgi:Flp pilus assembly pilin Flp